MEAQAKQTKILGGNNNLKLLVPTSDHRAIVMSGPKVKAEPVRGGAGASQGGDETQPAASPEKKDGEPIEFAIKDSVRPCSFLAVSCQE